MARFEKIDGNKALTEQINSDLEPRTLLASECIRQFRDAVNHKKTKRVGDYSLEQLLRECFNARDDRTSCEEEAVKEKYPEWAAMPVSLVAFKVNILVSLLREALIDVSAAPFIIDPTPNPEIPEDERRKIVGDLEQEILTMAAETVASQIGFTQAAQEQGVDPMVASSVNEYPQLDSDLIYDLIKQKKIEATLKIKKHAEEQAALLQKELYDKTTEGGYRKAIMEFIDDFATYPFACLHAPVPMFKNITKWDKDKFVEDRKIIWGFERISPFDLYWTEDCNSTQDGTAIFIKKMVDYDYLYTARKFAKQSKNSGYVLEAIEELIDLSKESRIPRQWSEFVLGSPEGNQFRNLQWHRGDNVEILIRYGRFTGFELKEMDFTDLEEDELYETKIILCGGQVIMCQINKNPGEYKRPVFTASFEDRNGSIVGVGLGQKLLSIHKAYRSIINLMMYNLGLSSEPITEIELTRVLQYMPDDWQENPSIYPGQVIPADGDRVGNGTRAIKFTQIPAITDSALKLAQFIFEQAHIISNIPAALHGQPVGTGANRTVRGLLTLQGNTLKPIQSALINLDLGIIEPVITMLYMLLVKYDDDFEYSGDCKIVAKGAASMVQREMEKQTAIENIQILGQLGQQVNPEILNRTIAKLLQVAGILEPGEEAIMLQQAGIGGMGEAGMSGSVGGGVDMNEVSGQVMQGGVGANEPPTSAMQPAN